MGGERDKQACPNLGHLLVALLISDAGQDTTDAAGDGKLSKSEELTKAIIKEAVTRNVVWMLDGRGAGMAELSYMEPSAISDYRLQKTFQASKTSYRFLMFLTLMRKSVKLTGNDSTNNEASPKTLSELRDALFARHGSPPPGAAAELAASIRKIQKVNSFPEFLQAMDITTIPTKQEFTKFLRRAIYESVDKGYSKWALPQEEALALRQQREGRTVEVPEGLQAAYRARTGGFTFFSQEQRRGGGGRGRR